jgi:hypothetical protein
MHSCVPGLDSSCCHCSLPAGVGVITAQEAWDWGCSGPILRASGIDWDLRKTQPYDAYSKMKFNVPIAGHGDSYDRYLVRMQVRGRPGAWQWCGVGCMQCGLLETLQA